MGTFAIGVVPKDHREGTIDSRNPKAYFTKFITYVNGKGGNINRNSDYN